MAPAVIPDLVQLQNVSLKLAQRITCDEEERQRFGYRLVSAYRFPEIGGELDRQGCRRSGRWHTRDASELRRCHDAVSREPRVAASEEQPAAGIPARPRTRLLGDATPADPDDAGGGCGRAGRSASCRTSWTPRTRWSSDSSRRGRRLRWRACRRRSRRPFSSTSSSSRASWSCEPMPAPAGSDGAPVLRSVGRGRRRATAVGRRSGSDCEAGATRPRASATSIRTRWKTSVRIRAARPATRACSSMAISPTIKVLDRFLIRDLLAQLAGAETSAGGWCWDARRAARWHFARNATANSNRSGSTTWMLWCLRPPSDGQHLIEACSTRPDFFYREFNAAIYVDGPPHDTPEQIRLDEEITRKLHGGGLHRHSLSPSSRLDRDLPAAPRHLRNATPMSTASLSNTGHPGAGTRPRMGGAA